MDDNPVRTIEQFNKAASERLGLAYHLIPAESLRRLSRVFLEGLEKYPEAAVNGRNLDGVVGNVEWQVERFNHAVDHLLKWGEGDVSEDHLAKVMWFCSVMIAVRGLEEVDKREKAEGKCKVEGTLSVTGYYLCRSCSTPVEPLDRQCCETPNIVYVSVR